MLINYVAKSSLFLENKHHLDYGCQIIYHLANFGLFAIFSYSVQPY
jgi:hypothetical protein